jgi:hypothetical protein
MEVSFDLFSSLATSKAKKRRSRTPSLPPLYTYVRGSAGHLASTPSRDRWPMSNIANKALLQATASKPVRSIILNQLAAFRTPRQSISDNYRPCISCGPPIKSEIDDNKKFFRIFLEQKISCQVRLDELRFHPLCQGFFGLH